MAKVAIARKLAVAYVLDAAQWEQSTPSWFAGKAARVPPWWTQVHR